MNTIAPAGHRPDIQGLRALAISLVLVFHLWPWLLPGGYVGVDVFFVISGFLITSHLMREIRLTGTVKLGTFWARRARRLLPASLLVLLSCTILVVTVLPSLTRLQELRNIGFAAVFGVNWVFAYDAVDYLGGSSSESIVQHYWSLAVEEQFYLIWPVILLLVALGISKASARMVPSIQRSTTPFLIVISLIFIASLVYSIYATTSSQAVAYFITPTRIWELAAGGLIAFLPASKRYRSATTRSTESVSSGRSQVLFSRAARPLLSWTAWVAILGCALLFDSSTLFPGYLALIPVVATGYLLWQQPPVHRWSPQRLSEAKPIQWLGDVSYPLYLWHWPLITVFIALRGRTPGPLGFMTLIALSLLLAWLTKRLVEDPLRFRVPALSRPKIMLPAAAAGIALVLTSVLAPLTAIRAQYEANYAQFEQLDSVNESCLGALALINNCDNPFARTSTVDPAAAREDSYRSRGIRDCPQIPNLSGDLEINCVLSDPSNPTRNAVLIGDSFSAQIAESLGDAASRMGWELDQRTLTGCTGFLPDPGSTDNEALRLCDEWGEGTYQEVRDDQAVDTVIISVRSLDTNDSHAEVATQRIEALIDAGKHVVVLHNSPGFSRDVPQCVDQKAGDDPCRESEGGRNDWLAPAAKQAGADLIELRGLLCPDGVCHTVIGGTVAYFDGHHLTHSFAATLSHWFERSLKELTPEESP